MVADFHEGEKKPAATILHVGFGTVEKPAGNEMRLVEYAWSGGDYLKGLSTNDAVTERYSRTCMPVVYISVRIERPCLQNFQGARAQGI